MAGILDRKRAMSDDHDPIALLTGSRDQNRRARQIGMGHLTKGSGIRMAICPPATATRPGAAGTGARELGALRAVE